MDEDVNNHYGYTKEVRKKMREGYFGFKKTYIVKNPDKYYDLKYESDWAEKEYFAAKRKRDRFNEKPKDKYLEM